MVQRAHGAPHRRPLDRRRARRPPAAAARRDRIGAARAGSALRGAAVGLLSLLRNEGGSVGTSLAQTLQERRDQFHTLRLGEFLDPFNPAVQSFLEQAQAGFLQQTGDPAAAQQLAWQALEKLREQQSSALAYFDCFWLFAVAMLTLIVVVLVMKRSMVEKGARVGGE